METQRTAGQTAEISRIAIADPEFMEEVADAMTNATALQRQKARGAFWEDF